MKKKKRWLLLLGILIVFLPVVSVQVVYGLDCADCTRSTLGQSCGTSGLYCAGTYTFCDNNPGKWHKREYTKTCTQLGVCDIPDATDDYIWDICTGSGPQRHYNCGISVTDTVCDYSCELLSNTAAKKQALSDLTGVPFDKITNNVGKCGCKTSCSFSECGFVEDGCGGSIDCGPCQTCGDGVIEGTEVCDKGGISGAPENLNGKTCASYTSYQGGTLACASDCLSFDTSGCYKTCGTGSNEACPDTAGWKGAKCTSDGGKLANPSYPNPEAPYSSLGFPSNTDCEALDAQFGTGKPVCNCADCNDGYEWVGGSCETKKASCDKYNPANPRAPGYLYACYDYQNPINPFAPYTTGCIGTGIYTKKACCSSYPTNYNYNYWVPIEAIP